MIEWHPTSFIGKAIITCGIPVWTPEGWKKFAAHLAEKAEIAGKMTLWKHEAKKRDRRTDRRCRLEHYYNTYPYTCRQIRGAAR